MSWAGVKGNKEFTLKTSKVWEILKDVINTKFPEFYKNMAAHFNNFHKDAGKEATHGAAASVSTSMPVPVIAPTVSMNVTSSTSSATVVSTSMPVPAADGARCMGGSEDEPALPAASDQFSEQGVDAYE